MTFYIIAGLLSAVAILFLLFKFDIRKVLFFDIAVDAASSVFLMAVFFGTFAGMMAAIIGGAIISVTLFIARKTLGHKKPRRKRFGIEWVYVPPSRSQ